MIYLILSILFSTLTVNLFKAFERNGVDTFQAIIFNYITCSIIGNILSPQTIFAQQVWHAGWFPFAVILGILFISTFNFIAQTAQKIGVSASMVSAKLSVVIPVALAIILYHEPLNPGKVVGIFLSLIAVYFISKKENEEPHHLKKLWHLPILVFLGSGCIDSLLNYVEQKYIPPNDIDSILTTIFTVAFIIGSCYLFLLPAQKKSKFTRKTILWGIILGLPNYFSMFFLVKTLGQFQGSYIFPINNIGIVAASTLTAVFVFKEKLSKQNKLGLALAISSILLISFV